MTSSRQHMIQGWLVGPLLAVDAVVTVAASFAAVPIGFGLVVANAALAVASRGRLRVALAIIAGSGAIAAAVVLLLLTGFSYETSVGPTVRL